MEKKLTARDFDAVDYEPSFWALNSWWMAPAAVFAGTIVMTVMSFPPYEAKAFAYIFAVPLIYWALTRPAFKKYALVMLAAQAVSWTVILGWLHNVTWVGLFLLGPFIGAWIGVWFLAVWWAARNFLGRPLIVRVAVMFGLAALWVFIEWTRTWLLSGFPWLPLAASQWKNTFLLQIASITGQGGVSFILVMFNLGFACCLHRMLNEKHTGLRKRSPELSVSLLVLLFGTMPLLPESFNRDDRQLAKVAFVQPDIPQEIKWSKENSDLSFNTLGELSMAASLMGPDIIIWPEAAPPAAMYGWPISDDLRAWVTNVAARAKQTPMLIGAVTSENAADPDNSFYNAAFFVDPLGGGVQPKGYYKRHLVPFGEYVPLRRLLGWLEKVTDVSSGDTQPGASASPLIVRTKSSVFAAGMLICYEDIFPRLAADNVRAGADAHVVVTNNGWFGTGGAAYQHAAHSVLRAVETRRPVIRCGNSGWSGWINEYGKIGDVMTNRDGTIYYRGTQTFAVLRDKRWAGRESFYVRHGDWFIAVCAALAAFGYAMSRFYMPHGRRTVRLGKPPASE